MKIKISQFGDSKGTLGKRVSLTQDGALLKEAVVAFAQGYFNTIESSWDKFGSVITSLKPNETLGLGVCSKKFNGDSAPLTKGRIVTKVKEVHLRFGGCARTLENFTWHQPPCDYYNVILIDIDDQIETEAKALASLFDIYPELGKLSGGYWVMPSAGAYIKKASGEWVTELSGMHVYFAIPNTISVSDVKSYLHARGWLSGTAYFKANPHKYGVSLLERHFIDLSVFSPERLDFIGGSLCGEGLLQDRGEPRWHPSPLEGAPNFQLDEIEIKLVDSLRREARYAEEQSAPPRVLSGIDVGFAAAIEKQTLPGMFVLNFDQGGSVCVWEVLAAPERYRGRTMSDPLFPEKGRCKAKYYYNPEGERHGRHVVNSFVKGGQRFFLRLDLQGALELIRRVGEPELKDLFGANGPGWEEVMGLDSELELPSVFDALKARGIGRVSELKAYLSKAGANEAVAEKLSVLEQMNARFAYVDMGSRPRFLEDNGKETLLRTRSDFLTAVEDISVVQWSRGKQVKVPAGEVWLKWEGKRKYGGIEFNPEVDAREFYQGGMKMYNRFRGFAVQPSSERKCGRSACGGAGCFTWFFGEGRYRVCKKGSWTYWLRTIYEVVCDCSPRHTRWVLDWLVEMVKTPVGGAARPGTSLVVRGGQGTGKGSTIWPIQQILGAYTMQCDSMSDVMANFNSFMEECILLFADEATWGGSKKESGKLKRMITEDTLNIEPKGIDRYKVKNHLRLFISSNSDWVVPAEDDERRYTVFDVTEAKRQDHAWFARVKSADLGELLDEIHNWEITSDLRHNIDTDALDAQKRLGWDVYDEFLADALDRDTFWDDHGRPTPVFTATLERLFLENYSRHRDSRELTPSMFVRRLRKKLLKTDAVIRPAYKVKIGNEWGYGLQMPTKESAYKLLGVSAPREGEE